MCSTHSPDPDVPLTGSLTGYATTPPWHVSQLQQPESALRSTQSAMSLVEAREHYSHEETPQPPSPPQEPLYVGNHIHPDNLQNFPRASFPAWTPINQLSSRKTLVDSNAFSRQYKRIIPGFTVNMHEYDASATVEGGEEVSGIHRSSGVHEKDDRVYHVGHLRGETYSGSFKHDDPNVLPPQAVQFIKEIKRKTMQPVWFHRSIQLLNMAKTLLEGGSSLVLERTSFVQFGEAVICIRPGCAHSKGIPADRYYLQIDSEESSYRFCLQCFERLWKGDYTNGTVGTDREEEEASARQDSIVETAIPQYDGPDDPPLPGLSSSRWAVSEEELENTPKSTHMPATSRKTPDDNLHESPASITSDLEWRFPPTPFQRVAASVRPGNTISGADRAALEYWKFVSRVQLDWETHARRVRYTRDYYNGLAEEDYSLTMRPVPCSAHQEVDDEALEAELGLRKKDVYGTELSEVLKKVADKKHQGGSRRSGSWATPSSAKNGVS